jgi:hypothetical protein
LTQRLRTAHKWRVLCQRALVPASWWM